MALWPMVRRLVFATSLVAALGVTSRDRVLSAAPPPATLHLRLTTVDGFSTISRRALEREAASIWRGSSVQLRWLEGNREVGATALRVLVTPDAVAARHGETDWAVGELLRFEGDAAIAIASLAGARRIVDVSQRTRLPDRDSEREYRIGLVLGRAIAHEIGHYLLQTNTHAASGLMRASITASEFADLRSAPFTLDPIAVAHLRPLRGALGKLPPRPFSYAP
jgi:hypothetical protein